MLSGKALGDAIAQAIALKNVNKNQVAREFDVSPPSVIGWINTGRIAKKHLDKLIEYFSDVVPPSHFGIGFDTNVSPAPDAHKSVPLISWVQAGNWAEAIDLLHPGDGERVYTLHKPRRHTFALRVTGDSMEPEFTDGDLIIVEPDETAGNGSFVVVRQDGNTTFKKLVLDGTVSYLKPLNEKYDMMPLKEDAVICGVVVEKTKTYKR